MEKVNLYYHIYSINRPGRLFKFSSGCLFEVGAYSRLGLILTIFSKCSVFILQQNNKW